MFVFIGCSGGGTSSMFCQKIALAAKTSAVAIKFYDVETVLSNPGTYGNEADVVLAYGGIDFIRPENVDEFARVFDAVLVAPQVRYRTKAKEALLHDYPVVVQEIDSLLFGRMQGDVALGGLLNLLLVLDEERGYVAAKGRLNKAGDKNMEIFIMGGNRQQSFFRSFIQGLNKRGIRVLEESFHLESLYTEADQDYDLRILYGNSSAFNERDLPKLAKRIDLVLAVPLLSVAFDQKRAYLAEYRIPIIDFDGQNYGRGEGGLELERITSALIAASLKTEYTSEITIENLEAPQITRKKFGLFSWTKKVGLG